MTIVNFMNTRFDRIVDTQQALRLLRKFETLNLPNLGIQDKYHRILSHYARDIDGVSRTYQKNKTDPPIARDLPPIAGKWFCIFIFFKSFFTLRFGLIKSKVSVF